MSLNSQGSALVREKPATEHDLYFHKTHSKSLCPSLPCQYCSAYSVYQACESYVAGHILSVGNAANSKIPLCD
jgi:hypothetical protein